jgi:uncharacterized protein involved in exopolysaccharide biosynthesis/Mrp family chromosome partitioning ATPase
LDFWQTAAAFIGPTGDVVTDMTDENTTTQTAGISPQDILFALFRRKWVIIICSGLGLLVAGGLFFFTKATYQSEAKLLLRYVQENRSASTVDKDAQIKSPELGGESIIYSELEILKSLDLATQVAEIIGPEKILSTAGKQTNLIKAATVIQKNLDVDVPRRSSIIRLLFSHTDPEVPQLVLRQLISSYLRKHVELHRGLGDLEKFLAQQTDQLKSRLNQTDDALRKIKEKTGVISPEETRRAHIELLAQIRQELFQVEAEIAERKAALGDYEKLAPSGAEDAKDLEVPLDKLEEYKALCAELGRNQTTKREMLAKFTPENPSLQRLLEQVARTEQEKRALEQQYPKLVNLGLSSIPAVGTSQVDLAAESTHVKALEAKGRVLKTQMSIIKTEAAGLEQAESEINELLRQRAVEEAHFLSYSKSLEQARIQENLGTGKITNIGEVQAPSFPLRNRETLKKLMLQIAAAGVALGLALALALELFLNPAIKRPEEVRTKLNLPLFFALPLWKNGRKKVLPAPNAEQVAAENLELWNGTGGLQPHFEAMRDRLIQHFEARKLTHKPKLVAVTSCGTGAGVSSIAKGLALSLSEAGDGNILLVDMSTDQGAAHSFMKNDSCPGLPEVLEAETRKSAQVQEKLYLARASDVADGLPKVLPKRFTHLMPKMKASDYDFIIFDLPPVSATSATARLACFMDLVLEVVEAEKTSREVAKRAAAVLGEGQANVSIVVNKYRKYLPAWLHQEL